jgi:catechol 2,3-dioxygenase-like lactoylglutathione lyase family enzyme
MSVPHPHLGLHHVALFTPDLAAAKRFWVAVMGYRVEWEPDADNCYLTSGADNLALHRREGAAAAAQRLDHVGVIVASAAEVESWHRWLQEQRIEITAPPKLHRDGATSLYCRAPDGLLVQVIHHPPIAPALQEARCG